jgi:hypothetical protein
MKTRRTATRVGTGTSLAPRRSRFLACLLTVAMCLTVLPVLAAPAAAATEPAPMSTGATSFDGWTYNPGTERYYRLVEGLGFWAAEARANLYGGHLVTVRSAAEEAWLCDLAATSGKLNYGIGYTDEANEGTWLWTSGEDPGYTNWRTNEPNNAGAGEDFAFVENCPSSKWNDVPAPGHVMVEIPGGPAPVAEVAGVSGNATAGGASAYVHQLVRAADAVRTFGDATLTLRTGTDQLEAVHEFAEDSQAAVADDLILSDFIGRLRTMVENLGPDAYEIRTPVSVIGVRGTDTTTISTGTTSTTWVDEGSVDVSTIDLSETITLEAGWTVTVYEQGLGAPYPTEQGPWDPSFTVHPQVNGVWGSAWPPDVTLTVSVEDRSVEVATDQNGAFQLDVDPALLDIQVGDLVTVRHGLLEETHQVLELDVDTIDVSADVVEGRTREPDLALQVGAHGGPSRQVTDVTANGDGTYTFTADFSEPPEDAFDLLHGTSGWVQQFAADGNSTYLGWSAPNPHFRVDPLGDTVWGNEWSPTAAMTVTVDGNEVATISDENGGFRVEASVEPGDQVTVTDGTTTSPTHTVTAVSVTEIDPVEDRVAGTAEPGTDVHVAISPHQVPSRVVAADGDGNWLADFSEPGQTGEEEADATYDIADGTGGFAAQYETDPQLYVDHWFAATWIGWPAPDEQSPSFHVDPVWGSIWGHAWAPDTTLTVTVDAVPLEVPVTSDGSGGFWVDVEPGALATGQVVEVTDGTTTRQLTITAVRITGVDAAEATVSGVAEPGTDVIAEIYDVEGGWRTVTTDAEGRWEADFSVPGPNEGEAATFGFERNTNGAAFQYDEDGDDTRVHWRVIAPSVNATPGNGLIAGFGWPAVTTLDVVIADDGTPVHDTTVDTDRWGNFSLQHEDLPVEPGQVITVTADPGGADELTRTLTVSTIAITRVDDDTSTVSGIADRGNPPNLDVVRVDLYGVEGALWREVPVTEEGTWTADFATDPLEGQGEGTATLDPHSHGVARQHDEQGNATWADWWVPNPRFDVAPVTDELWGNGWAPNAPIDITIAGGDPAPFETSTSTDGDGNFGVGLAPFDVQPGQEVTVTDGADAKHHRVTGLAVSEIDAGADTVSGTTDSPDGALVLVEIHGQGWHQRFAEVIDGGWTADFSTAADDGGAGWGEPVDLGPGTNGSASERDEEDDGTSIWWYVANPHFNVQPVENQLDGWEWPAESLLAVTIDRVGGSSITTEVATSNVGSFTLALQPEVWQLEPGDLVTVSDGATTKDHTVTSLTVDLIDDVDDVVSGTAEPGTSVHVVVHGTTDRWVTVGQDGRWLADFGEAGSEPWEGPVDITPGSEGFAEQKDDEWDGTQINWRVAAPRFTADAEGDAVWGHDFLPNATVDVTIDGPAPYTFTTSVETDGAGGFWMGLGDEIDLVAGQQVTVTDGTTTRTLVVTALTITAIDTDADTVSGTTDSPDGSIVEVVVDTHGWWSRSVEVVDGHFTADFSTPIEGNPEPWAETVDLGPGWGGNASEFEADGDSTHVRWDVPNPSFGVNPDHDTIWGNQWPPFSVLTVTVGDPEAPDFSDTTMTDPWGNFDLANLGGFDLQAGQLVTVSSLTGVAGPFVKSHTITELGGIEIDTAADTVSGSAAPYSLVDVFVHADLDEGQLWRQVQTDGAGRWTADFASPGTTEGQHLVIDLVAGQGGHAEQVDDDGDATRLDWYVRAPRFSVERLPFHLDDSRGVALEGEEWEAGPVAFAVFDDPAGDALYEGVVDAAAEGWFHETILAVDFEVRPGHTVVLTQGGVSKSLRVSDLIVIAVDVEADTISGTTDVGDAGIDVWVFPDGPSRHVEPADLVDLGDGRFGWTVDFGVEWGSEPAYDLDRDEGTVQQIDGDGDATQLRWGTDVPTFTVDPQDDFVWGAGWPRRAELTVLVGDLADPEYSITALTDPWGNFPQWDGPPFEPDVDLQAGQTVTVAFDLGGPDELVRTHVVTDLREVYGDAGTDTVSGLAAPDSWVEVYLHADVDGEQPWRRVRADQDGRWTASFVEPGPTDREQVTYDLTTDLWDAPDGAAEQSDEAGNSTYFGWRTRNTRIVARPFDDALGGSDWARNATLDVVIGDPEAPDLAITVETNSWGDFGLDLADQDPPFDLQGGQVVTVTDGVLTRTLTISTLRITAIDVEQSTISGVADHDHPTNVDRVAVGIGDGEIHRDVPIAPDGTWTAAFDTDPAPEEGQGRIVFDLDTSGYATVQDVQDNSTNVNWQVPPHDDLTADPASLSFGEVEIGHPATRSVTLTNGGTETVTISSPTVDGSAAFTVLGTFPTDVGPGATYDLQVRFVPSDEGTTEATLDIAHTGAGSPLAVPLEGVGIWPQVVGWGYNAAGQATPPAGLTGVVGVAGGGGHSLALLADGTVVGWGSNGAGQATAPAGLSDAVAVAAGTDHSLALRADGTVVGWGWDGSGRATPPAGLSSVVAIDAGEAHSLALLADGTVVGWGSNTNGQANTPEGLRDVVAISAGNYHNLALLADGTVVGWGLNGSGQATAPAGLTGVVEVAAGVEHSLALLADGTVVGWGSDSVGQSSPPAGLSGVVSISAGGSVGMALMADGTVVGWGYDANGRATPPAGLADVVAISTGNSHSLALRADARTTLASAAASVLDAATFGAEGDTLTLTFDGPLAPTEGAVGPVVFLGSAPALSCGDADLHCAVEGDTLTMTVVSDLHVLRELGQETIVAVDRLVDTGGLPAVALSPVSITTSVRPQLTADPTSLEFGEVEVEQQKTLTVTLTNPGSGPVTIDSIEVVGSEAFAVVGTAPTAVEPGATVGIEIAFAPTAEGAADGTLRIAHDGANSPLDIQLSGAGVEPVVLTRFEEDEEVLSYSGTWTSFVGVSRSGGSSVFTDEVGASVSFAFTGGVVRLLGTLHPNRGVVRVTIDGVDHGTVDLSAPVARYQEVFFEASGLGGGEHTVVVTNTNESLLGNTRFDFDALEVEALVVPVVLTRFEEDEEVLSYSGTWTSFVGVSRSGGSSVFTDEVGASVSFAFTGGVVRLLGTLHPNRGVVRVTIDGVDHGTVDLSAPVARYQEVFFEASGLGGGEHTVVVTNTNESLLGNTRFDFDALEVEALVVPVVLTRFEEDEEVLSYSGTWTSFVGVSRSGGSSVFTDEVGASVSFAFTGGVVRLLGTLHPNRGVVRVTIDGVDHGTVDLSAPVARYQEVFFEASGLGGGEHTVVVTNTNESLLGNTRFDFDALEVEALVVPVVLTRFEEDEEVLSYSGTWTSFVGVSRSGGSSVFTDEVGASVSFAFTGGVVRLLGTLHPNRGVVRVTIDGVDHGTVDLSAPVARYQEVFFEASGLGGGEHTVVVTNTNESLLGNTRFDFDALEVEALVVPVVLTRFEEDEEVLSYSGTWTSFVGVSRSGGSSVFTDEVGASVSFAFTGGVVRLLGTLHPNRGVVRVTIDGVDHGTVDLSAPVARYQEVFFEASGLGGGEHTVVVTNTNESLLGNTRFDFDALEVEALVTP